MDLLFIYNQHFISWKNIALQLEFSLVGDIFSALYYLRESLIYKGPLKIARIWGISLLF